MATVFIIKFPTLKKAKRLPILPQRQKTAEQQL
jgi:hypothetical protein